MITLSHDYVIDPRGWQTNDALVLFSFGGALAAVVSLLCFGVGKSRTQFAIRPRAFLAILADGLAILLLCVWIIKKTVG